jgi:hypothetical protein
MKGLRVDSLTTVVSTVKTLAFKMNPLSLDLVIDLMRCFPCLEKLYIQVDEMDFQVAFLPRYFILFNFSLIYSEKWLIIHLSMFFFSHVQQREKICGAINTVILSDAWTSVSRQ